jgi:hypothetical protein
MKNSSNSPRVAVDLRATDIFDTAPQKASATIHRRPEVGGHLDLGSHLSS